MVKLLIIDDDMPTCDFLKRYLEKRDYEIFIANNDKDAISITKEKKPKIVLLDIKMPGVSGITVLQKIKEIDKDVKVVMMTAVKDETMIELAKEYGASDYVTKPFSLEYLEKEVMTRIIKQLV